ncbi:MAG TPA: glycosyltransferase family 2 protein [Egibacteraceae bacterium]|nr:glycosyltransferase family 2 protein [Egibacteraceae bacterium]
MTNASQAPPSARGGAAAPSHVRRAIQATYLLPLKVGQPAGADLGEYIRWLAPRMETIVVDNSDDRVFAEHARTWGSLVRHVRPDPARACANGKVHNVLTGLALASHDRVVIADDDVRYDDESLVRTVALLDDHDLVRPQNYFDPVPWHAAWDTGRTLLNRAIAADYPGTLAVRAQVLRRTGGYDGNVLFENLELMRTVEAAGGRSVAPLDLYVRRLPPTFRHFRGQRVRQAYDEIARPARMAAELSVLPLAGAAMARGRWGWLVAGATAVVGTAEIGRRRAGGTRVFPVAGSAMAPLWVAERGVCSWLALTYRILRGGVPYAGGVLRRPATPVKELRRRFATPQN